MVRNVEIKAYARAPEAMQRRAESIADGPAETLVQCDTFFCAPLGRLKLREFADGSAELIAYRRPDTAGSAVSEYTLVPVTDPASLKRALTDALGVRGVVRKTRRLYLTGPTRIHLDHVEGLGDFLELEVVLQPGQPPSEGHAIAERLMRCLDVTEADLREAAYIDLLEAKAAEI